MYVDEKGLTPVTRFLDIVEVNNTGAKGLYQAIKGIFEENFIPPSNIIGYSSTLRQNDFTQFHEFVQAQPHEMLNLSQTRWLSLESYVTRILKQWEAFRLYLIAFVADGKDPSHTT